MAAKSVTTKKNATARIAPRSAKSKPIAPRTATSQTTRKVSARRTAEVATVEVVEPGRDELREAARVLKTKGSKKREKRAAASMMSKYGSRRGGQNRARNLSPEQRKEIARMGGLKRQEMARQQRELRETAIEAAAKKKARRKA